MAKKLKIVPPKNQCELLKFWVKVTVKYFVTTILYLLSRKREYYQYKKLHSSQSLLRLDPILLTKV